MRGKASAMHRSFCLFFPLRPTTAVYSIHCKRLLQACLQFSRPLSSTEATTNDAIFRPLTESDVDLLPTYLKYHTTLALQHFERFRKPKETTSSVASGVLVPLCVCDNWLSLLYTLRTGKVASHRRQVSFPGGMHEEGDIDLIGTALRETEEEIGICPSSVDVWGNMPQMMAGGGKIVVPVVGFVGTVSLNELRTNTDEVDSVFAISLRRLVDPSLRVTTKFKQGHEMPVFNGGLYRVWGLTAIITDYILHVLCGAEIVSHNVSSRKYWDRN